MVLCGIGGDIWMFWSCSVPTSGDDWFVAYIVGGERFFCHQDEGVMNFVWEVCHQAPHIALKYMLDCEGFFGGTAVKFLWELPWYGLVVDYNIIA